MMRTKPGQPDPGNSDWGVIRMVLRIRTTLWLATATAMLSWTATLCAGAVLNEPNGVNDAVGEGDDFATSVLGPAWDMSGPPLPNYDAVMINFDPGSFVAQNGVWEAVTASNDPQVRIHPASAYPDDPIDTSRYRLLSFRMYSSQAGQALVYWFPETPGQVAWTPFISVTAGWNTYTVDMATIGLGGQTGGATGWNGLARALRLDPIAASGVTIRFDWIRLTSFDGAESYPISWSGLTEDGSTLELFVDDDASGQDGAKIAEIGNAPAAGSFDWGAALSYGASGRHYALPSSLQPGDYYIYALVNGAFSSYSPGPVAVQAQTKAIVLGEPDGVGDVIGEGDDFATRRLGLPWDMARPPYPDFPTVFRQIDRASLTVGGGIWDFVTTGVDPGLTLHGTGLIGQAQPLLRDGSRIPIDAGVYRILTFRMYSEIDSLAQIFYFFDGTQTDFAFSNAFPVQAGWRVYAVDLAEIGTAGTQGAATGWTGLVRGLRIDPLNSGGGSNLRLDWARLTPLPSQTEGAPAFSIDWSGLTPVGATVEFFIDTDDQGQDGVKVGQVEAAAATGSFNWGAAIAYPQTGLPYPLPSGFEPGQYRVHTRVNGQDLGYSPGPLTINGSPVVEILQPSFATGEDYAASQVGNPWDMDAAPDIHREEHIVSSSYDAGVHVATSDTSRDPQLFLNLADPIDPARYKYAVFRYQLDGLRNIGNGSVSRFLWHEPNMPQNAGVTLDMIVYEGWQVYKLDLSAALLSEGPSWTSGQWTTFRFDPHEFDEQRVSRLDYVLLTAGDEAADSFEIRWEAPFGAAGETLTTTLYYDDDADFANGATQIAAFSDLSPASFRQPADFDGDGPDDALVYDAADPGRYRLTWDHGARSLSFENALATDGSMVPRAVDLNGDGLSDVAYWEPDAGEAIWHRPMTPAGLGEPSLLPAAIVDTGAFAGVVPQFNYQWSTPSGLGTYYIWIEVDDGVNSARWLSESPVAVDNPCRSGDLLAAYPRWAVDLNVLDLVVIVNDTCP